ncbi:hypothetical protein ACIBSS_17575 [Micromonospora aurantiaca]|uniref:hypothetical protein n=1 Tax=Micromonospora aurantiaca (nom. illeg.) TaxID=47850 RepID=UPI0037BDC0B0
MTAQRRPTATAESDAFRAAAYRASAAVRDAQAVAADRATRPPLIFESDRAAWADLREAATRLVALITEHEPAASALDAPPPGPSGGAPPRIAAHRRGITPAAARQRPEQEAAA